MSFRVPGAPRISGGRPAPVGPGQTRKIGIIGTSRDTLPLAPWDDPSWEFWAHTSAYHMIPLQRADVLFDLHPKHCWTEGRKNGFDDYYRFLKGNTTPIYMQEQQTEIPASVRFPREKIKQQWDYEFGSQTAEMVGLALYQGVTHLGFWGVEYSDFEYTNLRGNTVLWVGIAIGQGVQIVQPKNSRLLKNAHITIHGTPHVSMELVGDYGYDTHTPERYAAYKEQYRNARTKVFMPKTPLQPVLTAEDEAKALDTRMKEAAWREAIETFTAEDEMPKELLEMEQRQRERAFAEKVLR